MQLLDMSPEEIINAIEEHRFALTSWEEEFMDSLTTQLESGRALSPRQITKLEEIYARVIKE